MKKLEALMKQNNFLKLKNEEEIKLCIYHSLIYPQLKAICFHFYENYFFKNQINDLSFAK